MGVDKTKCPEGHRRRPIQTEAGSAGVCRSTNQNPNPVGQLRELQSTRVHMSFLRPLEFQLRCIVGVPKTLLYLSDRFIPGNGQGATTSRPA